MRLPRGGRDSLAISPPRPRYVSLPLDPPWPRRQRTVEVHVMVNQDGGVVPDSSRIVGAVDQRWEGAMARLLMTWEFEPARRTLMVPPRPR